LKSCREGFGQALVDFKDLYDYKVLGLDLSSATKTNGFAKACPDRFIECGIAEANGIGIAAGMAKQGHKVIVSSFGSFLTGRYDIIRCSIGMPNLPVILVGTHSGLSPSMDGPTQSAYEDLALMRSIPGMQIYQPATYAEAYRITEYLLASELTNPVYLRIGRQPVKDYDLITRTTKSLPAQTLLYHQNSKYLILNSGCLLETALEVGEQLKSTVVNVTEISNFDTCVGSERTIVTIEDHSLVGGLGSVVCETFSTRPNKVIRIGIDLTKGYPSSGNADRLYEYYNLTPEAIINTIKKYD
jgi:transketolase